MNRSLANEIDGFHSCLRRIAVLLAQDSHHERGNCDEVLFRAYILATTGTATYGKSGGLFMDCSNDSSQLHALTLRDEANESKSSSSRVMDGDYCRGWIGWYDNSDHRLGMEAKTTSHRSSQSLTCCPHHNDDRHEKMRQHGCKRVNRRHLLSQNEGVSWYLLFSLTYFFDCCLYLHIDDSKSIRVVHSIAVLSLRVSRLGRVEQRVSRFVCSIRSQSLSFRSKQHSNAFGGKFCCVAVVVMS